MTSKPMLMSAPMVRALLKGTKTVTRRLDQRWANTSPGMHVWFKETWAVGRGYDGLSPGELPVPSLTPIKLHYLADGPKPDWAGVTRSSLFMPRWMARLTRTVVSARLEPLDAITDEDAIAEGLSAITKDGTIVKYGIPDRDGLPGQDDDGWPWHEWTQSPRDAYLKLWNTINGTRAPASSNPTVVRLEFAPSTTGKE